MGMGWQRNAYGGLEGRLGRRKSWDEVPRYQAVSMTYNVQLLENQAYKEEVQFIGFATNAVGE